MLKGIRVIDLSRNLAAPYCTMLLGDLGADVIKVEMPGAGDEARGVSPMINGESVYFISINRGKKGITLNIKNPRGKKLLEKLLAKADVMVDNFRPGVLDRLGLTEEYLKKVNSRLICASLTGFGHYGPYRKKAAYDLVVQGYGGIMSITGHVGGPPTRVGISLGDLAAGLYLTIGILGALLSRQQSGNGDRIDVAMLDCQVALLENAIVRYMASGKVPGPIGNRHPSVTPFEAFPSRDSYIVVCAGNENLWESYCRVIGHPELISDPRFATNDSRNEHHDALAVLLTEIMHEKTTQEWIAILDQVGVPCAPVNSIDDVIEDEQIKARQMIISLNHPKAGEVHVSGCPIKSKEYPAPETYKPSPLLGEDNREIFRSLGLSDDEMADLIREKII